MAERTLGKITVVTAGTSIRATVNESDPLHRYPAHSYMVEVNSSNTGKIYVGKSDPVDRTNWTNVIAILPPPTSNIFPAFSATVTYSVASFNMAEVWIDADNSGESVLISSIEA